MDKSPLALYLKEKGYTQSKLATALGVTPAWIAQLARAETPLTGKVRTQLLELAPDVVAAQDKFYEKHSRALRKQLTAA